MARKGEELVELKKVISDTPIDTLWIYWETDMYYNIIDSSNDYNIGKIVVRTPDKILTDCHAYIIATHSVFPIPVGTYSISENDTFKLTVETEGYISNMLDKDNSVLNKHSHYTIPNIGEIDVEWTTDEENLYPGISPETTNGYEGYGGYGVYASCSVLERRDNNGQFWITDEFGNELVDEFGNILTLE